MTVNELGEALDEHGLTLTVHEATDGGRWVVWLHAADDPGLGVWIGTHDDFEKAVRQALKKWADS